jgi:hypothetical protein
MTTSLILSFFTCLIFAAFGLATWYTVLKNYTGPKYKLFAWTMFCASGIVGFMGLRTLLFGLGYVIWDILFALIDQLFLFSFFILCGSYATISVISQPKLARVIINFVIVPLSVLFLFLLFYYVGGIVSSVYPVSLDMARESIIQHRVVSEWGSEYTPPQFVMNVIMLLAGIEALLLLANFFKKTLSVFQERQYTEALFALSLIIFFVALGFDQAGNFAGWKLLLFRSLNISGAMLAYLTASNIKK